MKRLLAVAGLIMLTGCLNHNMAKVSTGMTKQEVIHLLGEPNSASAKDGCSYLYFRIHDDAFGRKENNYYFAFSDANKLVEFGLLPENEQEHGIIDKYFKGITNTAKTTIDSIGHAVNPDAAGRESEGTQPDAPAIGHSVNCDTSRVQ